MFSPANHTNIPGKIDSAAEKINFPPSFETREVVEIKLKEIMAKTDEVLTNYEKGLADEEGLNEYTGTRRPGERHLLCGLASEIIAYQINNDITLKENGVYAKPIQNKDLHRVVRQQFQENISEDEVNQAFQHSITLVYKPDGQVSLIDLTICQYFDPETGLISEGDKSIPVYFSRMPVTNKLIN
jgi:hypothetical protein